MIAPPSDEPTTAQLAQAAQRQELVLHYQPIIAVDGGALIGAEALLRWVHPDLGLLAPVHFLPMAEAAGLMPSIGDWVLREACRQMYDWQEHVPASFRLAVNVAASQVGPDFDTALRHVLAATPLPGERLEIELTESAAFGDPTLFALFDALRTNGVRFAADDFGTGYSCLQHLKCCPITTLKIDQSFVAGLADDARDRTIVRTVIQLAHGLGLDVVAEGVETSTSLEWLRQAGCDAAQGFLFARPMPADEFVRFVHQRRTVAMHTNEPGMIACCVCCKEIPLDAALTPEGAEYVEHFCGLECYQRFQARAKAGERETESEQAPGRQPDPF
jgi:EAL domain-containing protein (putative c-di-GMP-specific phosphodiesterase class I)